MTHHPQVKEENSSVRKADESVLREFDELLERKKITIIKEWSNLEVVPFPYNLQSYARECIKEFISAKLHTERAEIQQDINSVLAMLDGDTDRVIIANFVRTYLLNNNTQ